MFRCCVTSFVIYTLIAHAQEPTKLLHLYELLYKCIYFVFNTRIVERAIIFIKLFFIPYSIFLIQSVLSIKGIPNGCVQDNVIHAHGKLRDFRKA